MIFWWGDWLFLVISCTPDAAVPSECCTLNLTYGAKSMWMHYRTRLHMHQQASRPKSCAKDQRMVLLVLASMLIPMVTNWMYMMIAPISWTLHWVPWFCQEPPFHHRKNSFTV